MGNWLGEIALAVLVFQLTGSPLATGALFLAMEFLPAFCGPSVVAWAENHGLQRMLALMLLVEGAIFVVLAFKAESLGLPLILGLAAVDGALAIAARASIRALVATTLNPHGVLRSGNALLNLGFTITSALGPFIAGFAVATLGVKTSLLLDAASFVAVAALIVSARSIVTISRTSAIMRSRVRDGIAYVRSNPALKTLIGGNIALMAFFATAAPIEIVLVKETLGGGSADYGILLGCWGIGMTCGAVVFAAARSVGLNALILLSSAAVGLSFVGLGVAPTLVAAYAAAALGGLGNGVVWVALVTKLQLLAKDEFQARAMALLESSASAAPGIGFALGAVVASLSSARVAFVVGGIFVLMTTAVFGFALARPRERERTVETATEIA